MLLHRIRYLGKVSSRPVLSRHLCSSKRLDMIPRPKTKTEKAAWRSILRCDRQQKPSLVIPRFSKPDPRQKKQVNRPDYKMCLAICKPERKKHNPDVISRYYGLNFRQLRNTYSSLISPKQGRPGQLSSCQKPFQDPYRSSQVKFWDRQRQGWLEKQGPVALKPELKDRQSHWFFCGGALIYYRRHRQRRGVH